MANMNPDPELEKRLQFLRNAKVEEKDHWDCTLYEHLLGVRQLLLDLGARPALADAGLFHSVYGTETFHEISIPLSMRPQLQALIGEEAEQAAWLFGSIRRETLDGNIGQTTDIAVQHRVSGDWLPLTRAEFLDQVNLLFINELEIYPRMSWKSRRWSKNYLRQFLPIVLPKAQEAFKKLSPPWWCFWK